MPEERNQNNSKPHQAPAKRVVDRVIETALGVGGGAVTLLSGLLAAVLILYSGYVLYDTFATERAASSSAWDLLQFRPEILSDQETPLSSSELAEINPDYRAWLTVFDTAIDYPVVQGPNDLYYASHDVYNRASLTGAIYLAAGNRADFSDSYNLIYGHHMDSGAMFGGLDQMSGAETGVVITEDEIYDVRFFAVLHTDAYENRIYTAGNRMQEVLDFVRSGGENGVGVGTEVTYFDENTAAGAEKLVALSTCLNANTSGRLVVIGRMDKRIIMKDITVTKVWDDDGDRDGIRPESVTVTASDGTRVELSAEEDWTATISVRRYDNRGEVWYTWAEDGVQGYTLTGNLSDGDNTVLTNTHVPAVTSVTVRKHWEDEDDRDGIRPENVTAVLSDGRQAVLNADNGWSVTITDLPVFADGNMISYTWTEVETPGYTLRTETEGTVTTLINTHIPEKITVPVSKMWDDGDDRDGIRPASVSVTLFGNDVPAGSLTLDAEGGWSGEIAGLYRYENGKEIAYRWEEAPVEGYVLRAEGNVLTNVHAPAVKTLTVIKIWDDGGNRDGIRPRSLTLTLTGGHRVTLNEENNWTASVADLPVYENGEEIDYSWSENTVSGYTLSSSVTEGDRTVITNRHETETTVAAVTKVWRDDDDRDGIRPESVTVTLSNGEKRILNAENGWTAAVTGLPVSADGTPIEYRWTEEAVDGYTSAVTVNGTSTVFTNTHVSAAADLRIRKVWEDADDRDGIRPEEIAVTLLADGTPVFAAVLNEENHWSAAAENRPVYEKGRAIAYTWTEQPVDGYTASILTDGYAAALVNTHVPETTVLTVRKVWDDADDQDGIRPEELIMSLSDGTRVRLNAENAWTASTGELPVYADGKPIDYTWLEEAVDGYTLRGVRTEGTVTVFTNTHTPERTSLTVTKVWDDDTDRDMLRPSTLTVYLTANGKEVRTLSLNEANGWSASAEELPVYAGGAPIEYAWTEEELEGYVPTSETDGTATVLTNFHKPESLALTILKVWDDDSDRDGIRPDSVTFILRGDDQSVREVLLNEETGWTATLEVPVYDRGRKVAYTWTEPAVPGYTSAVRTEGETVVFTNTHNPETTRRRIIKIWNDADDQDGLRPDEMQVTLLADGETAGIYVLNAANGWTYTAEPLPVYSNGTEIQYTWLESGAENYLRTNTTVNGQVTSLTNTHVPAVTSQTVTKVWDDGDNQDGRRPDSLRVTLSNGTEVILNEGNGWTATVPGLPVFNNGVPVEYTWSEEDVEGYRLTDTVTEGTTTTLTNARTVYTLTVYYRFLNGMEAAPTVIEIHSDGETYEVVSPQIPGFTASEAVIRGIMPARDVVAVVLYMPNGTPSVTIETSGLPLGLGLAISNAGDCIE